MKLIPQKLKGWGYRMTEISYSLLQPFSMIHPSDRRTERQTVWRRGDIAYMLSRVIHANMFMSHRLVL